MIHLEEADLALVKKILAAVVPNYEVWAFGSRVTGERLKPFSDLDLIIKSLQPLPLSLLAELETAFTESMLPIKVDLVEWRQLPVSWHKTIEDKHEIIQPPTSTKAAPS